MPNDFNNALLQLPKRAESTARDILLKTFVDVGPLFALLNTKDHQVIFGRRGTGKTHALSFLAEQRSNKGDIAIYLDLRSIGSNGGIYSDSTVTLSERATRLLVDTLAAIHDALLTHCLENGDSINLAEVGPSLDRFADAITEVRVIGNVEEVKEHATSNESKQGANLGVSLSLDSPEASATFNNENSSTRSSSASITRSGNEQLSVNFGSTSAALRRIVESMAQRHVWILLDEWSSIPIVLQPYLADLLRRSLLPLTGLTLKIAAIEHRSNFQIAPQPNDYIGIELGADASADVNLDDFMVFDNDNARALKFYRDLINRHVEAVASKELGSSDGQFDAVSKIFTEKRSFEEFVRACEGVPRDAINILALAAQRALDAQISVDHVRSSARTWYQRDKEKAASANPLAHQLLNSIISDVIGKRKARAFLLSSGSKSALVDALYDSRVLHVLKRGVSTPSKPGERYDVYKLDYGCYVDLMSTSRAPQGLLRLDDTENFIEVPPDDYRAIRRAILDLNKFKFL